MHAFYEVSLESCLHRSGRTLRERGCPAEPPVREPPVAAASCTGEASAPAILVVRPSSLGDIVHALTIVADIRANRPEFAIDWVAERGFIALLDMHPGLRRVIPVAMRHWRHHPFVASTWREFGAFRHSLQRDEYAVVLDLQEQLKGALIARMARGVRHGPDRASIREPLASFLHDVHHRIDPDRHFIVRCRELAAASLGYRVDGPPRFGLVAPPPQPGAVPDRPFVVFFHGTSRADKLWPDAHWRRLVEAFATAGYPVVLPWGSDDERARSERYAAGVANAHVPPPPRCRCRVSRVFSRAPSLPSASTPGSCISPPPSARPPCRSSSRRIRCAAASASRVRRHATSEASAPSRRPKRSSARPVN